MSNLSNRGRQPRICSLLFLALLSLHFVGTTANAVVTTLLREDGDIGDPLPTSVYLGDYEFGIIPGDGDGDQVLTVHWTAVATNGACTKNYDLGTNVNGIVVNLASVGSIVIKADFTYRSKSTTPPTPVAPNTVTATITIKPPAGFQLIPFDQTLSYNFSAPGNSVGIQFQLLKDSGDNLGGYNMGVAEKINYIIPAGAPPAFGGNWGDGPPLLVLQVSGIITDQKATLGDSWPDVGLGQVFLKYTQTVGVFYSDWCNNVNFISLGTVTIYQSRSPTDASKWILQVTQP